eukprot:scpid43149/ scgid17998/ 
MPLGDWISFALFGDDDPRGRDGRNRPGFETPPWDGDDNFPRGSVDKDLEGMMNMMDQMMSNFFEGPHSRFGGGGAGRGGFGGPWDRVDHEDRSVAYDLGQQPSGRSLRHHYLHDVPETPPSAATAPSTSDRHVEAAPGHDPVNRSRMGTAALSLDEWPFFNTRMQSSTNWPFFSGRHEQHSDHGPDDVKSNGSLLGQSVVRTAVYSSSSVRRADGSVETTTYNRGSDGQVKKTITRQLPDQRTLTTYEETSCDGTKPAITREEYSPGIDKPSASPSHVDQFNSDWEQNRHAMSGERQDQAAPFPRIFSRLSSRLPRTDVDRPNCPDGECDEQPCSSGSVTYDWVRSWFR